MIELTVVIPAYNESLRIPTTLTHLAYSIKEWVSHGIEVKAVLIINDGSRDHTVEVAESFVSSIPVLKIHSLPQNQGKGAAVRTGLSMAQTPWILVADADMSTPWKETLKLAPFAKDAQIIMGSRSLPGSYVPTKQPFYREKMGRVFNRIMRLLTGLSFKDTQCGFKLIFKPLIEKQLVKFQVNRFAWDVELLLRGIQAGAKVQEVPIEWHHKDESRVHPVVDSIDMLWNVLKIRYQIWREG